MPEPVYSEHPAMFKNHPLGFILSVLLCAAAVGFIILMVWYIRCKSLKLEVVGNDIVLEEGLLNKSRTELNIERIRSVNVYQTLFNRMFGVGKVSISSAGDEPEIVASGMPRPHELRDLVKARQYGEDNSGGDQQPQ